MDYNEQLPCINHRNCKGYAVPGRAKCEYCIEADEIEKAAKIQKQLSNLEKKPRTHEDVWR